MKLFVIQLSSGVLSLELTRYAKMLRGTGYNEVQEGFSRLAMVSTTHLTPLKLSEGRNQSPCSITVPLRTALDQAPNLLHKLF